VRCTDSACLLGHHTEGIPSDAGAAADTGSEIGMEELVRHGLGVVAGDVIVVLEVMSKSLQHLVATLDSHLADVDVAHTAADVVEGIPSWMRCRDWYSRVKAEVEKV
jgi:hypothetical protein